MEARESRGEASTREELSKLTLNEPGQAFPVPQRGRPCAKRLEMIPYHLEQDALRGIARLVATGRCGHATRIRVRSTSDKVWSIRPNSR
jgi:hypothetical protein